VTDAIPCRVLLIGMMGSGKSTIGERLAAATGWPYVDNDDLVRRATGTSARRLVAEQGEGPMRAAERAALLDGVRVDAPAIVGVAAGTITDPAARDALRDGGHVVWLHADAGTLARRAAGASHRPWLDGDATAWMTDALAEREPLYRSVADHVFDTGTGSPDDAVRDLVSWLAERGCVGTLEP
jgi:shikimate kinase